MSNMIEKMEDLQFCKESEGKNQGVKRSFCDKQFTFEHVYRYVDGEMQTQ